MSQHNHHTTTQSASTTTTNFDRWSEVNGNLNHHIRRTEGHDISNDYKWALSKDIVYINKNSQRCQSLIFAPEVKPFLVTFDINRDEGSSPSRGTKFLKKLFNFFLVWINGEGDSLWTIPQSITSEKLLFSFAFDFLSFDILFLRSLYYFNDITFCYHSQYELQWRLCRTSSSRLFTVANPPMSLCMILWWPGLPFHYYVVTSREIRTPLRKIRLQIVQWLDIDVVTGCFFYIVM